MPGTETVRRTNKTLKNIATKVADQIEPQEPLVEDPVDSNEIDIFVTTAREIIDGGEYPLFHIQKNGEFLTTKNHPYSWTQLQKEFGPGSYKVSARIQRTGAIKKWQTQQIADPRPTNVKFAFGEEQAEGEGEELPPMSPRQPGFMEYYLLKNDMEEKSRLRRQEMEDKAIARQEKIEAELKAQQASIDAKLRELDAKKESNNSDLFKLMLSQQQESAKQIQAIQAESTKTLMTLMTTIMTKPKDELKPEVLAKMLYDAKKEGKTEMKEFIELVDKKAESRAEELAERSGGEGNETLGQSLIKGFLPIISQAVSNMPKPPTPEQVAQMQELQRRQNLARLEHENRIIEQRRLAANRNPPAVAKNPAEVIPVNEASPSNPVPIPVQHTNGAITDMKEKIKMLVMPLLMNELQEPVVPSPNVVAEKCRAHLVSQGIALKVILDNFTLNDILAIADQYNLDEEAKVWFRKYHEYFVTFEARSKERIGAEVIPLQQ